MTATSATLILRPTEPAPVVLSVPAEPELLSLVRQAVTAVAELVGMSSEGQDDLRIAVTEAATNVVVHAYPDRAGTMCIELWPSGNALVVHVTDHGTGLVASMEHVSPGLGLGLHLIAALTDDMFIVSPADGSGTHVGMTFRL